MISDTRPIWLRQHRKVVYLFTAGALVATLLVAMRTAGWLGCDRTGEESAAIAAYKNEPPFSLIPPASELFKETSTTHSCDGKPAQIKEVYSGPEFVAVTRSYSVGHLYDQVELLALSRTNAEAAGWGFIQGSDGGGSSYVLFCKNINSMTTTLDFTSVQATNNAPPTTLTIRIEGRPHQSHC